MTHSLLLDATNEINLPGGGVIGFFDEYCEKLVNSLTIFSETILSNVSFISTAHSLLTIGTLFILGYEMWPVIMGRKSPDILVLLRPFLISCALAGWGGIVSSLNEVQHSFTNVGKQLRDSKWQEIATAQKQLQKNIHTCDSIYMERNAENLLIFMFTKNGVEEQAKNDPGFFEQFTDVIKEYATGIYSSIRALFTTVVGAATGDLSMIFDQLRPILRSMQHFVYRCVQTVLMIICQLYFQTHFLGICMIGYIGMGVLAIFGPLMFGLSVFDPWRNLWADWIMKYMSLAIYPFLAYVVMAYLYGITQYEIEQCVKITSQAVEDLNNNHAQLWEEIISTDHALMVYYLVLFWVGGYALKFVPELAGMIFPGGGGSAASAAAGFADGLKPGVLR